MSIVQNFTLRFVYTNMLQWSRLLTDYYDLSLNFNKKSMVIIANGNLPLVYTTDLMSICHWSYSRNAWLNYGPGPMFFSNLNDLDNSSLKLVAGRLIFFENNRWNYVVNDRWMEWNFITDCEDADFFICYIHIPCQMCENRIYWACYNFRVDLAEFINSIAESNDFCRTNKGAKMKKLNVFQDLNVSDTLTT